MADIESAFQRAREKISHPAVGVRVVNNRCQIGVGFGPRFEVIVEGSTWDEAIALLDRISVLQALGFAERKVWEQHAVGKAWAYIATIYEDRGRFDWYVVREPLVKGIGPGRPVSHGYDEPSMGVARKRALEAMEQLVRDNDDNAATKGRG